MSGMDAYFELQQKGRGSAAPQRPLLPPQQPQLQSQLQPQGDDEVDPLDAFMAGLNETLVREKAELEEKQRREAAGEVQQTDKERFFDDEDIAAESIEHLNAQKALSVCVERSRGRSRRTQPLGFFVIPNWAVCAYGRAHAVYSNRQRPPEARGRLRRRAIAQQQTTKMRPVAVLFL